MTAGDFTVLLPVYAGNIPSQLMEAFESSVHRQQLRPDAVVVVEDGPIPHALDESLNELERTSPVPVRRVSLVANGGLARALNAGLQEVTTEFVARMDADDVSAPERFARQLPVIRDQHLDVLGTGLAEFSGSIDHLAALRVPPLGSAEIRRVLRFAQPFNHPTVVMRTATLLGVGGYPTGVGRFEDYVLFARLIASGAIVDNLPDPLVFYRSDDGAYARRGGWGQFRSELQLQRELRRIGIVTSAQQVRNLLIRAPYRLIPASLRTRLYRRFATRPADDA